MKTFKEFVNESIILKDLFQKPIYIDYQKLKIETEGLSKDKETINFFKNEIKNNQVIPPIFIDQKNGKIIDGNHRAEAYKELKLKIPIVKINRLDLISFLANLKDDFASWYKKNII